MSKRSFLNVVKNYEKISRLGRKIINHKKKIVKVQPELVEHEQLKQEDRIEMFNKEVNKANKYWRRNTVTVNEYWTGLS